MSDTALSEAVATVSGGKDLATEACRAAITEIIDGAADPALVAAFLTALRMKGETAEELAGAVLAVRARMEPLEIPASCRPLLDTCGTGGDGANTVNVSTATAIVVAACGVRVAKHGNRSATGNSGSSEVLTELGVDINAPHELLVRGLEDLGIAFLFAPRFHPAMRHAAPIRRLLPFRTLFNLVGPLANPARPETQIIGVPDRNKALMITWAFLAMWEPGDRSGLRAYVIAGGGDLDEVSLWGTNVVETVDGNLYHPPLFWEEYDFGLPRVAPDRLRVSGPVESAGKIRDLLQGERGPVRDVVLANAAAALMLVGKAASLPEGVAIAAEAIDRGLAARLLRDWAALTTA